MPKTQPAPPETRIESMALSDKQRKGRAANAVAELLVRKLLVPKVFVEPKGLKVYFQKKLLQEDRTIDVLAIDRAGSGDIHAVEILLGKNELFGMKLNIRQHTERIKTQLNSSPVHFKYLAVDAESIDWASRQLLFADDGIGRIGIIEIVESPSIPPEARIVVSAERFRVEHDWIKKFDNFQKKTPADMEFRG